MNGDVKEDIVGKQFTTNSSGVCVVTKYVRCNEVHIKFLETGFERVTDTNSLKNGTVKDTSVSKTKKKYVIGERDIVGEVFDNNKGESYQVLKQLGTSKFKIKFIDSGYETEVKKNNIEIGSIKDRSNFNEYACLIGHKLKDNRFGIITVKNFSDRGGEKVLVCDSEDNSLRFILTKEQVINCDLSSFGVQPVVLNEPLPFSLSSEGLVLYKGEEFDTVDFEILNVFFYLKDDTLYHRLIRRDSIDESLLKHKTTLAGKVAGFYPKHNPASGHVSLLGIPFHVSKVKAILNGELECCYRRKFKDSDIEAEGVQQEYSIWNSMRGRCNKGYAKLSDEFENFWDWLDWAKQQRGFMCKDENGKTYQVETDLFSNGEKIYSKDTVVFVPNSINQMCKPTKKGDLPKGVQYFHEKRKGYRAYGIEFGKQIHLGYYRSLEEAVAVAKEQRVVYVNKLMDLYGETVEPKVFKALLEDKWSD